MDVMTVLLTAKSEDVLDEKQIFERIAVAVERLEKQFCKPIPVPKRIACLGTATYSEEEKAKLELRKRLFKKTASQSKKRIASPPGRVH